MSKQMILRLLYDPEDAGQGAPVIDLVLIHGLDGDLMKTWTHNNTMWPRDLFPLHHPQTRVMTFGYNGNMYRNDSIAGVRDNARALLSQLRSRRTKPGQGAQTTPIIFLAHCLGGLIVKQALCFANAEPQYTTIAESTRVLLFFGTPHCGADKSQWRSVAEGFSALESPRSKRGSSILSKALIRDSDDLQEISEDFAQLTSRYTIVTYYEMEKFPGTDNIIVSATSARMGLRNETAVPVSEHHLDICKFKNGFEDPTFLDVAQHVQAVVPAKRMNARQVSWEIQSMDGDGDEGVAGLGRVKGRQVPPLAVEPGPAPAGRAPRRDGEEDRPELVTSPVSGVASPVEEVVSEGSRPQKGQDFEPWKPQRRTSSKVGQWLMETFGGGRR
ncbi:hypothetical protein OQA88_10758 [Cercophora sp. LCS_1]